MPITPVDTTPIPTIDEYEGDLPLRSNRATFAVNREAWLTYEDEVLFPGVNAAAEGINAKVESINTTVGEIDGAVTAIDADRAAAQTAASDAGGYATDALGYRDSADAYASAAAASAGQAAGFLATSTTNLTVGTGTKVFTVPAGRNFQAGQFIQAVSAADANEWMFGTVTSYAGTTLTISVSRTGSGAGGTAADWNITVTGPEGLSVPTVVSIPVDARSSNTALVAGDRGELISMTSTYTQTFTAAATLGAGWWCYLANEGTGEITLDPNGSEQIDGLTSFKMYPGEVRIVTCTGTGFKTVVLKSFSMTLTATATITKPPGYSELGFDIQAPGAGGGSGARGLTNANRSGGGGGSGGARRQGTVSMSELSATFDVEVGAPGTGGAAQTTNTTSGVAGTAGGDSRIVLTNGEIKVGGGKGGSGGSHTSESLPEQQGGSSLLEDSFGSNVGRVGASQNGYFEPYLGGSRQSVNFIHSIWGGGMGGGRNGSTQYDASGARSVMAGPGGGQGGFLNTSNAISYGPGAGATGRPGSTGGNGGAASPSGAATAGADGVGLGSGGGGGGASSNGNNSGKGGDGQPGETRIWGI